MSFFVFRSSFLKFLLSAAALFLTGCASSNISAPKETACSQVIRNGSTSGLL